MTPASTNLTTRGLPQGSIWRPLPNVATRALYASYKPLNTPKASSISGSGLTSYTAGQASGWAA